MLESNPVEALKLLTDFGLTPTEAVVYFAAATIGGGTAKEIAIAAGKERAQTHHALLKLQELGIVQSSTQVPVRFRPIGVKETADHLYSLEYLKLQKLKESRAKLVRELSSSRSSTVLPVEGYSIIKGRANTYLKMVEVIQSSKKDVLLIMSATGLTRLRRFRNFYRAIETKAKRGVQFRVISEITPDNQADAKIVSRIAELRHVKNQITNASIYDGKIGSVALSMSEDLALDAKDHIALWSSTQSFVSTLRNLFDSVWFVAEPSANRIKTIDSEVLTAAGQKE